jgi:hypothetical protein
VVLLPTPDGEANEARYVIERNIPGVHNLVGGELRDAAATSNKAIRQVSPGKLTWEHSMSSTTRTFCVYLADSAETVMAHAKESASPPTRSPRSAR